MEADHYKKLIVDGNEKKYNARRKHFINTYNNTIIISNNKILKYFNIFIWKIHYSPLRKLTVQINDSTIYFFWG